MYKLIAFLLKFIPIFMHNNLNKANMKSLKLLNRFYNSLVQRLMFDGDSYGVIIKTALEICNQKAHHPDDARVNISYSVTKETVILNWVNFIREDAHLVTAFFDDVRHYFCLDMTVDVTYTERGFRIDLDIPIDFAEHEFLRSRLL